MAEFTEVMQQCEFMCDKMGTCNECPLGKNDIHVNCEQYVRLYPSEAETIITEWYEAHKPCTNAEMLNRVFGNDVPFMLVGCSGIRCGKQECEGCQHQYFWTQAYKGGFKNE